MLTSQQLTTLLTELNNDPCHFGYSTYLASTDVINLANLLNFLRDGVTPSPVNAVIGPSGTITGATNANPIVITSTAHGLTTGLDVTIAGVLGNTNANGTFAVTVLTANTFSIPVAGNAAYTSGGTWQLCVTTFASGGLIPTATVGALALLNVMAEADIIAGAGGMTAAQSTALTGWVNALFTSTPNNINLLNKDGSDNVVAKNLKLYVGGGSTASGQAIKALQNRFGSRVEQILNTASLGQPGQLVNQVDVAASLVGHY